MSNLLCVPLSKQLRDLSAVCPAIKKQFVPSKVERKKESVTFVDPLLEDEHTVCRGLVHKYKNRVLVLLTMNCAAYCRFCTRRRIVSDVKNGVVSVADLDKMVAYIKKHSEIQEVIFSGGDPLTVPDLLKIALKKIGGLPQIKVIRVGTRLHFSNPALVNKKVLDALRAVKNKPLYLMVHFEHPSEITPATKRAIKLLQSVSTMLLSQTVSLRDVNDSVDVLYDLFSGLIEVGVKPYYLFRCDLVKGAEHFLVDFKKERKIVSELRRRLSGIAMPLYVIDVPGGSGKVPVPLDFWPIDVGVRYRDFNGKSTKIV